MPDLRYTKTKVSLSFDWSRCEKLTMPVGVCYVDATFQVIRMPSRNVLPLVPIYDNTAAAPSDSLLQADLLQSSNPNLYPQNAMPLTIKHPEFNQQGQGQQSTPNDDGELNAILPPSM